MRAPHSGRRYAGRTQQERRTARREQLIGAAVGIWREQGWSGVTMRGVCTRARLTDRYFYEHFDDRDALLVAVWDQAQDSVITTLLTTLQSSDRPTPAARLREAISAVVHTLPDDPHGAQVLFSANLGTPVLQRCRQRTFQRLTDLLTGLAAPHLRPGVEPDDLRMSTLMGLGGFIELVTAWQAGIIDVDSEQVIDHAARIGALFSDQYLLPRSDALASVAVSVLATLGSGTGDAGASGGPPGETTPGAPGSDAQELGAEAR